MTPQVAMPSELRLAIVHEAAARGVDEVERAAVAGELGRPNTPHDLDFRDHLMRAWSRHDHVVIRGAPVGIAEVVLCASMFGAAFACFGGPLVRHFRMSPWTRELSHTTRPGEFHTDINTALRPPRVTVIQAAAPDPGDPPGGELRVVRVADLMAELRAAGATSTLQFLCESEVTLVNDRSSRTWTGRIFDGEEMRYHPESLRAGVRRGYASPPQLEEHVDRIHLAAMAASSPIHLEPGDILASSNTRALHRRGACTVVFRSFPMDFIAREVYVLHLSDEPE